MDIRHIQRGLVGGDENRKDTVQLEALRKACIDNGYQPSFRGANLMLDNCDEKTIGLEAKQYYRALAIHL